MNRTKGIIAAGTLTGLVLITLLALGFGNLRAAGGGATAVTNPATVELPTPNTAVQTNDEALQAWQEYSAQLEQTVRTMQERETAYQTQLDTANQTILQLQNDINSANSAPAFTGGDNDSDEHEHEEHEEYDDD